MAKPVVGHYVRHKHTQAEYVVVSIPKNAVTGEVIVVYRHVRQQRLLWCSYRFFCNTFRSLRSKVRLPDSPPPASDKGT